MIKIFTFASHRVDFIGLQMHSFRKYLKEDFEFVVFNNAKYDWAGGASYNGINEQCGQIGVSVIDIQKDKALLDRCQQVEFSCSMLNPQGLYSNANVAHAYAFCWAWENIMYKEQIPIAIFDSDVFLIQPTKLTDTLNPHHICNISDGKPSPEGPPILYMWPTFVLLDMVRLPDPQTLNWYCGQIRGVPVDVGGQTHHYLQAHPELDVYDVPKQHFPYPEIAETYPCPVEPPDYDEFYLKDAIVLHYRSGSNWNHRSGDYHQRKTEWLKRRIEEGR